MTSEREVGNLQDIKFKHPFNFMITGPSQSGKTTKLREILEFHNQTIHNLEKEIIKVVWCYGKWQKYYEEKLKGVDFKYINDMPNEDDIKGSDIIVIDDLMHKINQCPLVSVLFTAGTHHDNQSVIVLTQNFFQKGEICATMRKNSQYLMFFKDPGDTSQIRTLAWRMFPEFPKYLLDSYRIATQLPHGYLLIDRTQNTPDNCRLRTNIVPNKDSNYQLRPFGFDLI